MLDNSHDKDAPDQAKKGRSKLQFILISVMLIIIAQLVVVIFLLKNKPSDSQPLEQETLTVQGDKTTTTNVTESTISVESTDNTIATDDEEETQGLLFADAIEKCNDCKSAIDFLIEMQELICAFGYSETKVKDCSDQKYMAMHHNCKANVISVENYPYTYRNAYGFYTGQWQGAGPVGEGSFIGKEPISDRMITYTGDWKYGLPDGYGELSITPFLGGWNQRYSGEMKAGLKDGVGVLYEARNLSQVGSDWLKTYRLYEETTFEEDIIAQVTRAEEYSMETNQIVRYYEMIGNKESGWVETVSTWNAGELSPSARTVLEKAVLVGIAVFVIAEVKDYQKWQMSYDEDREAAYQNMMASINEENAREEAERLKRLEEKAASDKAWGENQWSQFLEYKDNPYVPEYKIKNYYYNGYAYRY